MNWRIIGEDLFRYNNHSPLKSTALTIFRNKIIIPQRDDLDSLDVNVKNAFSLHTNIKKMPQ